MRMFQVCVCGEPLQCNEAPTPEPKGSEVLLKVLAAGVCHSDIHLADGWFDLGGGKRMSLQDRGMKLPVTLGHENVGEVIAVGPDAKGVKIGQKMLADPWIGCGKCPACLRNEDNLCTAMRSLGVFSNGGYATHMMVPHPRYLFDIGDMAPERAAPLACSGVTTYGALKKVATLKSEPTVIIGAGGLGLMCLALHQKMGGHSAIVVDIDPAKRDAAKKAGAKAVVDGKAADAVDQIKALTNGGAWGVVDLVGSSQSARMGYDSLAKGGRIDKTREAIESEYNQNPMGNVKNVSLKEIMPDVFETPAEVMARLQAQSQAAASALTPDAPTNVVGRRGARKLVDKAD